MLMISARGGTPARTARAEGGPAYTASAREATAPGRAIRQKNGRPERFGGVASTARASRAIWRHSAMAKGQVRGNKEAKKPKKEKPKTIAAAPPTVKIGTGADKKK
jgi:hypothetical protein